MLYLTSDHFSVCKPHVRPPEEACDASLTFRVIAVVPLGLVGFYRYLWYILRLLAAFFYQHIPVPQNPTYLASEDVTIIVPTIDADENFTLAAHSWLAGHPKSILIITEHSVLPALQALADRVNEEDAKRWPGQGGERVQVASVKKANKRVQMSEGIRKVETDIIVFADDDAIWPPTMLPIILAPFEDQKMGGVGTSQVVKPCGDRLTVWEVLAAFRLSIRNIEISASTHIDGGIPCLSGRTAAYRTIILQDPKFLNGFTNDLWCGKKELKLNSGDDKFITRWMVSHGWNTYAQCCEGAQLQSTMKPDWRFLKQVLRWTRNTWRSDLRSIFIERHVWYRHPFTAFTMIDKFLNPFTLLAGPCLVFYLCIKSLRENKDGGYNLPAWNIILSWFTWLTITRTAKLAPHLWKRPQDVVYVPAWVAFGYFFAAMKLYALFTLHEVGWGTRAGVGDAADDEDEQAATVETQAPQQEKTVWMEPQIPKERKTVWIPPKEVVLEYAGPEVQSKVEEATGNTEKAFPSVRMREEVPDITLENMCGGTGDGFRKLVEHFSYTPIFDEGRMRLPVDYPLLKDIEMWRRWGLDQISSVPPSRGERAFQEAMLNQRHLYLVLFTKLMIEQVVSKRAIVHWQLHLWLT
ncbi:hypothetical protein P7C70_g2256, partial [Phenoliferia sp. Uapishka_3]